MMAMMMMKMTVMVTTCAKAGRRLKKSAGLRPARCVTRHISRKHHVSFAIHHASHVKRHESRVRSHLHEVQHGGAAAGDCGGEGC